MRSKIVMFSLLLKIFFAESPSELASRMMLVDHCLVFRIRLNNAAHLHEHADILRLLGVFSAVIWLVKLCRSGN